MKRYGIEHQTKLIAIVPIIVIAVLLESYFIHSRFDDLDHALLERSQLLTRQLAASSEYPVFTRDLTLLKQQVDSALAFQDVKAITILDATYNPMLVSGQMDTRLAGQKSSTSSVVEDKNRLRLYEPIQVTQIRMDDIGLGGEPNISKPLGMVMTEFSKERLNQKKTEIVIFNLLVTLITLSVTLMIALRVSKKITMPILGMRQAIIEIGGGALDTRISPKPSIGELYDLADGINNMAIQLKQDRTMLEDRIRLATVELRAKKEEAESASYAKTRFLAAASHDLRQPMHALGLFIGELQAVVNSQEQRKVVVKIEESVHAMTGLLNSLLDISRLDAGVIVPQAVDFNIEKILNRVEQNYRAVADAKSISFRVINNKALVHSDPILLERIIVNLVSNALRYTPLNGSVLVGCRKRDGHLLIEIRDSGVGIPPDEQKNIFQEFVQLANLERDRSMGLGLGLAIVERLSLLMDHPVGLRSAVGRGSVFSVSVPLAQNQTQTLLDSVESDTAKLLPSPAQVTVVSGAQILVVDDDPLVRSGTEGILSAWGYLVSVASCLGEIKSKFPRKEYDLVVCDYRLPDGTGLEIADYINHSEKPFPPCILVSGDTSPDVLLSVTESGFHFLSKPVRPAKLRSLIQFLLNSSHSSQCSR